MRKNHIKVFIALCGIAFSSVGIFNNSISAFNNFISDDLNVYRGSFALYLTIYSIFIGFFNILISKLLNDKTVKMITISGITIASLTLVVSSTFTSLWQFYIMAAIRGFGVSCYQAMIITNVVYGWFKKNSGFFNSCVMCVGGLGGVIIPQVINTCVNAFGWRVASVIVGIISFVVASPVIFTKFTLHPEYIGETPYGNGLEVKEEVKVNKNKNKNFSFISISFLILLFYGFTTSFGHGMAQNITGYGESIGMSQVGVNALSAIMFANIISKLISGVLYDKYNEIVANVSCLTVSLIGAIGLLVSKNPTIIIISAFCFGFIYAPVSIGYNFILKEFYDYSHFKKALPVLTLFNTLGNAVSVTAYGYLYDFTHTYKYMFIITISLTILNILLLFVAKRKSAAGK